MSDKQLVLGDGVAYDLPSRTDLDRLRADLQRCMAEGRTLEVRIVAPAGTGETTLVVNGKTVQAAAVVGPAAGVRRPVATSVARPANPVPVVPLTSMPAAPPATCEETRVSRRTARAPHLLRWSRRWGVATVVDGTIVGVSGHHLTKRAARHRSEALQHDAGQQADRAVHFQVVRRNSASNADWGVRPEVAATSAHPPVRTEPAVHVVAGAAI